MALQIRSNCTGEDLLLKSIMKNSEVLAKHGISARGPTPIAA
jgi:hypothetical protein